jgi:LPS-assembly lipoprotein
VSILARIASLGLALLVAALALGCGFQLQGRTPLPAAFAKTYVEAEDRQSDFVQDLRKSLLGAGKQIAPARTAASAVVRIVEDKLDQRVLSVSGNNVPREYELVYTVRFAVEVGGKEVIAPEEVSTTGDFSFDERILLAKEREQEILRAALARDLVSIVMRRLASL